MLVHKGTKVIHTERLILRPFQIGDAADMYHNWARDEEVCKYLSWEPHQGIEETEKVVSKWILDNQEDRTYNWVIEYQGRAIGGISVVKLQDRHQACEIGYCIGQVYWNQGIVTEAFKSIMEYLFKEIGMNRIVAKHDTENIGSGRVMQKVGMKYEGTMRQARLRKDGIFGDIAIYALLREERM